VTRAPERRLDLEAANYFEGSTALHSVSPVMPKPKHRQRDRRPAAGGASRGGLSFLLVAVGLIVATVIVFLPAIQFGFVTWDDGPYVFENPSVLSGLSLQTLSWAFTNQTPYWHPVTWISHLMDVSLLGPAPQGMHAVNIAIHLANTLLLLTLLTRLTSRLMPSAIVAALFALHPLHVESVAWIAERKDLLSTLFFLAALISYQNYVKGPTIIRYVAVATLFALSLMCKPMFVTLPVLLLVLDYWPLARFESLPAFARLCLEKAPLVILAAASAVVTYLGQQQVGTMSGFDALPIGARAANAVVSYAAYLRKTVWPVDLAAFYPYPDVPRSGPAIATACLLFAGLTVSAVMLRRRVPYLLFGWLWYVISLLPVIGLIQVGNQAMADRFTYIPLVGIFVAAVWAAGEAIRMRGGRLAVSLAAGIAVIACTVLTRAQVLTWASASTMWTRVLEVTPDSYYAHSALGAELADQGNLEAARRHQEEALRLRPSDPDAHNELGKLAAERGDLETAIRHFSAAVERNPNFGEAVHNLGTALLRSGRPAEAIVQLRRASDLLPYAATTRRVLGEAHFELALALARAGRRDAAIKQVEEGLRTSPTDQNLQNLLSDLRSRE
jgi:protein O-mannosyl-transferase